MLKPWSPLGLLLVLLGCGGPPGPAADPGRIAQLQRGAFLSAHGERVSYLRAGHPTGRRVIFIHGTPGSARGWADFLLHPPPGFEYIAVDRPGFGESGPEDAVVPLQQQVDAIAPLLGRRAGGWPILVGHSLGAPIAAQVAVTHPGQVGALVLVAGSLDPGLERTHWAQPLGERPALRRILSRELRNANRELMGLKPQLASLAPSLPTIRCPVEVVHGDQDDLVPIANVPFMRRQFPAQNLRVTVLPGRNHFLPWTSRSDIEQAIRRAAARGDHTC